MMYNYVLYFQTEDDLSNDHKYSRRDKKRCAVQNTKKVDCPAKVYLKAVIKFPQFKACILSDLGKICPES